MSDRNAVNFSELCEPNAYATSNFGVDLAWRYAANVISLEDRVKIHDLSLEPCADNLGPIVAAATRVESTHARTEIRLFDRHPHPQRG